VPNTATRIVGEDGGQLGVGEAGEVAIKGPQVVPGYWEDTGDYDVDGWVGRSNGRDDEPTG